MKLHYLLGLLFIALAAWLGTDEAPVQAQIAPVNIKINFQDEYTTPPIGYEVDFGEPYKIHLNGLRYGWLDADTFEPRSATRYGRNRDNHDDPRLATLMHFQHPDIDHEYLWEMDVPNGVYNVYVAVGDTNHADSLHVINIENKPVIRRFAPREPGHFYERWALVVVTDGRLTIDTHNGINTKINYIIVENIRFDRPFVLATDPGHNDIFATNTSNISIGPILLPNGPLDMTTLNDETIYVYPEDGHPVEDRLSIAALRLTGDGDMINLRLRSALQRDTAYVLVITEGIYDVGPDGTEAMIPVTIHFRTGGTHGLMPEMVTFGMW